MAAGLESVLSLLNPLASSTIVTTRPALVIAFPVPVFLRRPVKVKSITLLALALLRFQLSLPLALVLLDYFLRAQPCCRIEIDGRRASPSSQCS